MAVHRPSELEQPREELLREVERTVVGHVAEDRGIEDVDAGVDRVREHLTPRGLLQEALDAPVLSRDDDAEVERVVDCLERDRHGSFAFGVEAHQCRQVEVGERVARDDEERLVESPCRKPHRTRRPHRRRLQRVVDRGAERFSVAEVRLDRLGQEGQGDGDVGQPVRAQQIDDVLHARFPDDGHHRLRLVRGQRAQPSPLSPRHDDRSHGRLTAFQTAAAYDTAAATASATPIQKITSGQSVPAGVAMTNPMPAYSTHVASFPRELTENS